MSKHAELIAQLEAAEGFNKPLVGSVLLACGLNHTFYAGRDDYWSFSDGEMFARACLVLASIDAALVLLERVLPSMLVENLGEMRDAGSLTGHWLCQLAPRGPRRRLQGAITAEGIRATLDADSPVSAPTPALALCIAILKALEAKA